MTIDEQLIYDVGMHNGDDTAYYLHLGFRVVAIEADPTLVAQAHRRFAAEIAAGRLTLLPVGVAPQAGIATFWLSDGQSVWNSFNRANATRRGSGCRGIEVACRPFHEILAEHGVPHYLKIDIETYDRYCLQALDPSNLPQHVSIEITDFGELLLLRELGYDSFKLVLQGHHAAVADETGTLQAWLRRRIAPYPALVRRGAKWAALRGKLARLARKIGQRCGLMQPPDWRFPFGSSGPFGDAAPGDWLEFEEAAYRFLALARQRSDGMYWCDVHATCRAAATAASQAPARAPAWKAPVEAFA